MKFHFYNTSQKKIKSIIVLALSHHPLKFWILRFHSVGAVTGTLRHLDTGPGARRLPEIFGESSYCLHAAGLRAVPWPSYRGWDKTLPFFVD